MRIVLVLVWEFLEFMFTVWFFDDVLLSTHVNVHVDLWTRVKKVRALLVGTSWSTLKCFGTTKLNESAVHLHMARHATKIMVKSQKSDFKQ